MAVFDDDTDLRAENSRIRSTLAVLANATRARRPAKKSEAETPSHLVAGIAPDAPSDELLALCGSAVRTHIRIPADLGPDPALAFAKEFGRRCELRGVIAPGLDPDHRQALLDAYAHICARDVRKILVDLRHLQRAVGVPEHLLTALDAAREDLETKSSDSSLEEGENT